MPYNPNPYNPYGMQLQQAQMQAAQQQQMFQQQPFQQQQAYNGIVQVADENEAIQKCNFMPPNSVSHPFFLPDNKTELIVFKDANNSPKVRYLQYEDVTHAPMAIYVTKEDFAAAINDIKEAINGKPTTASAAAPGQPTAG